jgi:hypothetical protein|tara:strand:+ start:2260 stop:2694 length:435 start_codon:yes stop_codon:yes gene_type:complete
MAIDPNWVRENPEEAARQIELLTKECEQYRAAEEVQIALREKLQEEHEALAAHVDRIKKAEAKSYPQEGFSAADWIKGVRSAVNATPSASLARLRAQHYAEALENAAQHLESIDGCHIELGLNCAANELNSQALELRRQAGGVR